MEMTRIEMQIEQMMDEVSAGLQEVKKRRPIGGAYELDQVTSDFTRLRLLIDSYIDERQKEREDQKHDRPGSA